MSETNIVWSSARPVFLRIIVLVLIMGGFATPAFAQLGAPLIISEFRLRGPSGANDEFVEIYNPSDAPVTVTSVSGTGYALVASDGVARIIIPNGTIIPARGHYLGANSVSYSLAGYAPANATYTTDITDNAGIALFMTSVAASFTLANRVDAVGSTSEANVLYKEGSGYPALTPFSINYSFYRASVTGFPRDTNNNAADFVFVDTNGTSAGAGQRLGAPGPENLAGPNQTGTGILVTPLDGAVGIGEVPNFVRDFTSDPANNSTFGTIALRRRIWNNTGANITRLRIRFSFVNTFPSPSGVADLRPRTSSDVVVSLTGGGNVTVRGTTLEQPPSQPNGGGFNSSMGVGFVTLGTPLAAGGNVPVNLLFGIQQNGVFRISMNVEALPSGGASSVHTWEGRTFSDWATDGRADLAVYRAPAGQWWIRRSPAYTDALMIPWGLSTDLPALGDYDGDGLTDPAVFRPGGGGNSFWFFKNSSSNYTTSSSVHWGTSGDLPVPGYYDTDRRTDPTVYRPSTGQWLVNRSTGGSLAVQWGTAGDIPVPADYDGDGRTDIAIYRPSTGQWFIKRSDSEYATFFVLQWGVQSEGDIPVPADYDGDGKADLTVYRPNIGYWFVRRSSTGYLDSLSIQWGVQAQNDQPMPGDYDGDGKIDPAVYRPGVGLWYVLRSSTNYSTFFNVQWGNQGLGDIPVRER